MSDSTPPPAETKSPPPPAPGGWRKVAAGILAIALVAGAVALALHVWGILERRPRTDDAVARANVVGIAPRVPGQIIHLYVEDNQQVKEGDLLFELDPEDFKLAVAKARADLATLDQQIGIARSQDTELKFGINAAEASLAGATAEFNQASNTLQRMLPLLPQGFAKADDVDKAQTAEKVAAAAVAAAQERLNTAQTTISPLAALQAQREAAVVAVHLAELNLSYCQVKAPFSGRVINLNISPGGFAPVGVPIFQLLDTRKWYVIAEFREAELRHVAPGAAAEVYLLSAPDRSFNGKIQGVGWAVEPSDEIDLPHSLPIVRRELNWVHISQRFPVRIEVENPDPELFRMGASAFAVIK